MAGPVDRPLQRLALSGDSADGKQPNELRGSGRACHRNGRASLGASQVLLVFQKYTEMERCVRSRIGMA
jgi:hypothetical protein